MACCLKGLLGTGLSRDRFRGLFPGIVSGDCFRGLFPGIVSVSQIVSCSGFLKNSRPNAFPVLVFLENTGVHRTITGSWPSLSVISSIPRCFSGMPGIRMVPGKPLLTAHSLLHRHGMAFLWHWSSDMSQVILDSAVIVVMSIAALLIPSTARILFFGAVCTGFCLAHCVGKSKK